MACAAFLIFLLLMSRTIEYSVRIMTENFIILQVKFWGTSTTDIPALFFDLTTLHMGSFAAAGFSTTDYDDWETIAAGYYNAI